MTDPKVVFEDSNVLVLDKPMGWITNSATTTTTQPVVQEWVRKNYKSELSNLPEYRDGIVHRLDKETSGLLLVAKTREAFGELQRQFKQRLVQKTYTALVHGRVLLKEGMIDSPVGRLPWRRDRFGVLPGGREAVTLYKVVGNYTDNKSNQYTLLELYPKTGRTHQIRIHLKHIGHPIVGDSFYAGRKTARNDRMWCPRLFLHAGGIRFFDPASNKEVSLSSPLPSDLVKPLESLVKIG